MAKALNKKIETVCFFSPSSYPFFYKDKDVSFGGAELQMFLLAESLAKNSKFDFSFFLGNYGQSKAEQYQNISLIRSISLPKYESIFSKLIKIVQLFFLLRKHKPDVIITTTANSLVGIISFFARMLKIRHLHRTAHQKDVDFSWIKNNGIKGKIYKYGLENADAIVTQSIEYQTLLKKTQNLKSSVLRNAFPIKPKESKNKNGLLWVSRFQYWKNPDLFIKLAAEIKKEHFTMICPYNKKDKKAWTILKQKATELANVTFIEKVAFSEIQEYFNKAKLFVNTSDFEGFPNTFMQAAQAKTPIISYNVSPDNFITKYNCGIFANNDFEKMLGETKRLLQDDLELKNKGENCLNYLKKNHDINIIEKQLEQIINKII